MSADWLGPLGRDEIERLVDLALGHGEGAGEAVDLAPLCPAVVVDIESVASSCAGILDPIGQAIQFITDVIYTTAAWVAEAVPAAVKGFIDWLHGQLDQRLKGTEDWMKEATKRLTDLGSTFQGFVNTMQNFPDWFRENIADPITEALKALADALWEALPEWLRSAITGVPELLSRLREAVDHIARKIWELLPDWLKDALTGLRAALSSLGEAVSRFLDDPLGALRDAIEFLARKIWELLPEPIKDAIEVIREGWERVIEGFREFIEDPIGTVRGWFEWLARKIWELLPDWLKGAIEGVRRALERFVEGLRDFLENPVETVKGWFEWLARKIWELLPEPIKGAIETVRNAWERIIEGFRQFIENPVETIKGCFEWLAGKIWELLPEPAREAIERIRDFLAGAWDFLVDLFTEKLPGFFGWLWERFQEFASDPLGFIGRGAMAVANWFKENVGGALRAFAEWAWEVVRNIAGFLFNVIKAIVGWLVDGAVAFARGVVDVGRKAGEALASVLSPLLRSMFDSFNKGVEEAIKEGHERARGGGAGELDVIGAVLRAGLPMYFVVLMLPKVLKGAAGYLGRVRKEMSASGTPLGVGAKIKLAFMARIASILYQVGDAAETVPVKLLEALTYGFTLWGLEPLRYAFRYFWREKFEELGYGWVPFEIPPLGEARELVRRMGVRENRELFKQMLIYRGYPDWIFEHYTASEEEFRLTVRDRFGTEREIPLSPLWYMPPPSDLVRMMIKDIFGVGPAAVEQFAEWAYRLGFHRDIAYLYYFLHFRYPSPERLWRFASRAMAGLLWYTPSADEESAAAEHARAVGAHTPEPPTALNFETRTVLAALTSYLKWQDYANFAWFDGFTSDAWLVLDAAADVPGKIDARWMTKWALLDHMAGKGIGLTTPSSGFLAVVEGSPASPQVYMDLTLLCRMLQATGLHPHYVPVVAVAEAMNMLSEERTFLRTGVVDMYRHGASGFEAIDRLMDDLVTATFKVAYVDIGSGEWREGYVNVPVKFLPAERRVLELRAVIDRYMRVWREMWTEIERGYREFIISRELASKYLRGLAEEVNKYFREESRAITGREMSLALDESYLNAILAAWEPAREVYTFRRIRYWFYRVLGWLVYRLAFGYVTEEDIDRITTVFARAARLAEEEVEAIRMICKEVVGIIKKEYIPTPAQLATIVEVLPRARRLVDALLEERGVPEEWRPIWRDYITIKPTLDEVKKVITVAEDLCEYFMISEGTYEEFLRALIPFGYELRELELMKDRARLLRWRRAYRELVGTPRELAAMAEYVPGARRLALAEVRKRIDALPIGREEKEFLYKMWEDYVRIRPVYDEVRREVTELISDYATGLITWEQFEELLNQLREWGLDEWEIDAYKFIAMMRRARYAARSS